MPRIGWQPIHQSGLDQTTQRPDSSDVLRYVKVERDSIGQHQISDWLHLHYTFYGWITLYLMSWVETARILDGELMMININGLTRLSASIYTSKQGDDFFNWCLELSHPNLSTWCRHSWLTNRSKFQIWTEKSVNYLELGQNLQLLSYFGEVFDHIFGC